MAASAEILQEIRDMRSDFGCRLGNLETQVALTNQTLAVVTSKVENHDKILVVGNGDLPVKQLVRETKDKLDAHIQTTVTIPKQDKKEFWSKTNLLIIGAVVTQIGIAIATFLRVEVLK